MAAKLGRSGGGLAGKGLEEAESIAQELLHGLEKAWRHDPHRFLRRVCLVRCTLSVFERLVDMDKLWLRLSIWLGTNRGRRVQGPGTQPGARGEDDATQRPTSLQKSLRSRWPTSSSKENYLLFNLKVWAAIMQIITFTSPFQTHIKVCFPLKDHESKKIDTFPSWVNVGQRDTTDDMGRCDNPCNELIPQRGVCRAEVATRTYTPAGGWSIRQYYSLRYAGRGNWI